MSEVVLDRPKPSSEVPAVWTLSLSVARHYPDDALSQGYDLSGYPGDDPIVVSEALKVFADLVPVSVVGNVMANSVPDFFDQPEATRERAVFNTAYDLRKRIVTTMTFRDDSRNVRAAVENEAFRAVSGFTWAHDKMKTSAKELLAKAVQPDVKLVEDVDWAIGQAVHSHFEALHEKIHKRLAEENAQRSWLSRLTSPATPGRPRNEAEKAFRRMFWKRIVDLVDLHHAVLDGQREAYKSWWQLRIAVGSRERDLIREPLTEALAQCLAQGPVR